MQGSSFESLEKENEERVNIKKSDPENLKDRQDEKKSVKPY